MIDLWGDLSCKWYYTRDLLFPYKYQIDILRTLYLAIIGQVIPLTFGYFQVAITINDGMNDGKTSTGNTL